jgi:hypothetical protein
MTERKPFGTERRLDVRGENLLPHRLGVEGGPCAIIVLIE